MSSPSSAGSANLWPQKGWLHCVSEKSLLSIGWELILGDSHNSGSVPSWQLACRWVGCSFNQAQVMRAGSVAPPLSPIPIASQSRNPFPRNCWRIPRLSGWSSLMSVSFPKALNLPKTAHMKQKWLSSPQDIPVPILLYPHSTPSPNWRKGAVTELVTPREWPVEAQGAGEYSSGQQLLLVHYSPQPLFIQHLHRVPVFCLLQLALSCFHVVRV